MTVHLTHNARFGGCAAKIGPGDLSNVLCGIDIPEDDNVLVGIKGFEDAGVYRVNDDTAIVQTLDFFTPVVDDPYAFGQIAAANALSDIYAMGARPVTALNIVCFSPKKFGTDVLREILKGGIDKIRESGTSLLGGHSVQDDEIKYGLSVTGLVHSGRIVRNAGAIPGDLLILTKPLGTGVLITALRAGRLDKEAAERLTACMASLNDKASRAMIAAGVHAATDVTGFGLAGHLTEMIRDDVGVELYSDRIPCLPETKAFFEEGWLPQGFFNNKEFYSPRVSTEIEGFSFDLLFDPQTSGGLLVALGENDVEAFSRETSRARIEFWNIGRFIEEPRGRIILKPSDR
jgi:selenide, water dikinase